MLNCAAAAQAVTRALPERRVARVGGGDVVAHCALNRGGSIRVHQRDVAAAAYDMSYRIGLQPTGTQ